MFVTRQMVSRLLQQQVRRYHDGHFKAPSMDELPVPRGSWADAHTKKQSRYNTVLAAGIAFATVSLVTGCSSGLLYMNYYPPKSID